MVWDLPLAIMREKIWRHRKEGLSDNKRNSKGSEECLVLHTVAAGITVNLSSSCDCVLQRWPHADTKSLEKTTCLNLCSQI